MSTTDVRMTKDLAPPAPAWTPPPEGRHRADAAADRGNLDIADQVVEKIAAVALAEVDEIGGAARRVLGVPLGSDDPDRRPRVNAAVTGSVVTLDVWCTVAYPAPVGRATDAARTHLIARIGELTGLDARQVDIAVTALTTPTTARRRELT